MRTPPSFIEISRQFNEAFIVGGETTNKTEKGEQAAYTSKKQSVRFMEISCSLLCYALMTDPLCIFWHFPSIARSIKKIKSWKFLTAMWKYDNLVTMAKTRTSQRARPHIIKSFNPDHRHLSYFSLPLNFNVFPIEQEVVTYTLESIWQIQSGNLVEIQVGSL